MTLLYLSDTVNNDNDVDDDDDEKDDDNVGDHDVDDDDDTDGMMITLTRWDSHFIFKYCILAYRSGWGIFKKNWVNPDKVGMVVGQSIKVHMRSKPTQFPFEILPT